MKDVIERMLKVEDEARTLLGDARKQADDVIQKGRREATAQADKIRLDAHNEAARKLEGSREALKKGREERLAAFDRADVEFAAKVRKSIPPAVERVVKRVAGEDVSG